MKVIMICVADELSIDREAIEKPIKSSEKRIWRKFKPSDDFTICGKNLMMKYKRLSNKKAAKILKEF